MKRLLIFLSLLRMSVYGQKLPLVNFNHFYTVIDSTDLHALQKSAFINNKFAAVITRIVKAGDSAAWTGTYFDKKHDRRNHFQISYSEHLACCNYNYNYQTWKTSNTQRWATAKYVI
jgi:hypothetical protein